MRGLSCVMTWAAARPSFNAVSAVTGSTLATPRTPSVPKIFFACATVVIVAAGHDRRQRFIPRDERRFTNRRFLKGRFGKRPSLFHLINLSVQGAAADPEL